MTSLPGYDSLIGHRYCFYWSGNSVDESRKAGVGFAIKNKIAAILKGEQLL